MYPERGRDNDKTGGGNKGNEVVCLVNSCVQRTISAKFAVFDGSKKQQETRETKALIRCNPNIQEGGECFSTHAAAARLTCANTFP